MIKRHKTLKPTISFGFTLIEILIVVAIIVILAAILFAGNVQSAFQKARDNKRKQDLNKLVRIMEDYFNDKNDYPTANDPPDGNIAGAAWGTAFDTYVAQLPADPLSPKQNYYYQVNRGEKKLYIIYAKLENKSDAEITRVGCQDGCGPMGPGGKRVYNYFVSSQNLELVGGIPPDLDPGLDPDSFPIPTSGPTIPQGTPTPTFNPIAPTDPNVACTHNQCCSTHWCGALVNPPGSYCGANCKCWYDNIYGWLHKDAFPPGPESCQ